MAILTVTELQEGTDGSLGIDIRGMTRRFHITTDDPRTAKILAESDSRIPQPGAIYSFTDEGGLSVIDLNRIVDTLDYAAVDGKPTLIDLTVNYRRRRSTEPTDNPLLEPALISIDTFESEEPIFFDINDQPIQNKAFETFDPPLTETFVDLAISITINEQDQDLEPRAKFNLQYHNKLNKTVWQGVQPRKAWLRLRSNRETRNSIRYWRTTYTIILRAEGWDRKVINQGFKQLKLGLFNGILIPIQVDGVDHEGKPLNAPAYLDQFGQLLGPSLSPNTITFKTKEEIDFNPLFTGIDL